MTKVAIVILNWNGIHFLKQFLPTLVEHSGLPGAKIIVADNNSSDDSKKYLKEHHPGIRLIELQENHGFADGYNRALKQIEAEYYLLLNSDIEVTRNWLAPLIAFMDKNHPFAACSPLLLDHKNREKYEYAGAAGGYIDKYGYTFCRGRLFNNTETADDSFTDPTEVFWATGAALFIRASVFHEAGGFDPFFFAHMEEVDLCWRLKNRGYKLAVIPESKVYHVGGGTLPKSNPFKTYLNYRNNLLLLHKNLPDNKLRRILFIRRILDGLSATLFLLKLEFREISSVIKAHRDYYRKKKVYNNYRIAEQQNYSFSEHDEMYDHSVVVDYFLYGNKAFSKLRDDFAIKMNTKKID